MKVALVLMGLSTVAAADPLTVEVKPATLIWKRTQNVAVELVVTNPAKTTQSMKVMSCSWTDHVTTSDAALAWAPWGCDKNFAATVTLEPGKSRTWKLEMFAAAKAKLGAHALQLTFKPEGLAASKSNTVTVTVK